jgi:hypothetical protein
MSDEYRASVTAITVVDGVEVDVTVRGDEDRAEKVLMDLKERLGVLGYAYESQTPPEDLTDIPSEYRPLMTPAWGRLLGDTDE